MGRTLAFVAKIRQSEDLSKFLLSLSLHPLLLSLITINHHKRLDSSFFSHSRHLFFIGRLSAYSRPFTVPTPAFGFAGFSRPFRYNLKPLALGNVCVRIIGGPRMKHVL